MPKNNLAHLKNVSQEEILFPSREQPKLRTKRNAALLVILFAISVFPLFLGGRHELALTAYKILFLSLGAFAAFKTLLTDKYLSSQNFIFKNPALFFLLTTLGFQVIPLPINILSSLSPQMASLYSSTGSEVGFLTANLWQTTRSLTWVLALISVIVFSISQPRKKRNRSQAFSSNSLIKNIHNCIILSALMSSVIALGHLAVNNQNYFGLYQPLAQLRNLSATNWPFVNPNHLAVLLEIALILNLSYILPSNNISSRRSSKYFISEIINSTWFRLSAHAVIFTSLLLTLSTAGLFLGIFSQLFLVFLYLCIWKIKFNILKKLFNKVYSSSSQSSRKKKGGNQNNGFSVKYLFFSILAFSLFTAFVFGGQGISTLSKHHLNPSSLKVDKARIEMNQITWEIIKDYPLFGAGLGSWKEVAQIYSSKEMAEYSLDFAHNDPFQLISEIGALGTIAFLVFLFSLIKSELKYLDRNIQDINFIATKLAIICFILHSLVDFPFHIPALAIFFTLLVSCLVKWHSLNES